MIVDGFEAHLFDGDHVPQKFSDRFVGKSVLIVIAEAQFRSILKRRCAKLR
jgi:hypothetical protein